MRQRWLAVLVCGGCVTLPASTRAQSVGDPTVIQGIGPASGGQSGYDRRRPQRYYRTAAPAPSPDGGGLLGFLFGERPRRYVARYNGPAADGNDYNDQPLPSYSYRSQPGAYSNAPRRAERAPRAPDPRFMRQEVAYDGAEAAGTVVIDTPNKFLYLVEGQGRALRYGIGVGRPGFTWSGVKTISRKAEWPAWTPPPEMLLRRPDLPTHMEGGPGNPLGARAMYLGSSMYRIHGTTEPETIGTNVSSGCIRLVNEDVIDLYQRVRVGTKVIVL